MKFDVIKKQMAYLCVFFSLFPARAGVILGQRFGRLTVISVPRASGGDPVFSSKIRNGEVCSPRERG